MSLSNPYGNLKLLLYILTFHNHLFPTDDTRRVVRGKILSLLAARPVLRFSGRLLLHGLGHKKGTDLKSAPCVTVSPIE